MAHNFYSSKKYRTKQSSITKQNWRKGHFDFLRKREIRVCARISCSNKFEVIPSNAKIYCGQSCATIENNKKRGGLSNETKRKISNANKGREYPSRQGKTLSEFTCERCTKIFHKEAWKKPKYCGGRCSIKDIGSRITSPKAARGKAGIRSDINKDIYFYSRWEANIARLYNYKNIVWEYSPTTFDIGNQNYTPDFYLPKQEKYIEVKNFWGEYSKNRHKKFKETHPDIELEVILKKEYLRLEEKYAKHIPEWEYKNG